MLAKAAALFLAPALRAARAAVDVRRSAADMSADWGQIFFSFLELFN
jgi:hypothetical protein